MTAGAAESTYFHNRIRNLITTDVTGMTYANVGRAIDRRGRELHRLPAGPAAHRASGLHLHGSHRRCPAPGVAATPEAQGKCGSELAANAGQ